MFGSSHYMERHVEFAGILSDDKSQNPGTVNFYQMLIHFYDVFLCLNCNFVCLENSVTACGKVEL
jgi:hypothetical protein